jgi:type IV pilus assembly protein PilB
MTAAMSIAPDKLKSLLAENDLVTEAQFDEIRKEADKRGVAPDVVLVERNLVPDVYLGQLVAEAIGYPHARLEAVKIPDHILKIIPERVARRSKAVAFGTDKGGRLLVALRDPEDLELVRLIEKKAGVRVVPHFATEGAIRTAIEKYAEDLESAIRQLLEQSRYGAEAGERKGDEDEGVVVAVLEKIMSYGYQHGASDIHIEPREKEVVVRYRIDGILHDVVTLPRGLIEPVATRIKVLAKLRTDEHFAAQDGKFQEIIDGERIDVRVSILPVVEGEKIVMRLLTEKGRRFNLEDLGFSEQDMKRLQRHLQRSFGMILATGPTGSGKTTSMYAVLKILNTRDVNIATIEDPIEYAMEGVNQIQVNPKTNLTFAAGLRSIVRQDPDIIMVGEIRDEETAGIAVNAAMTGHLVLSTLHTNDAATTLPRLRDMDIEPFLIASSVNVIIAQRLVRRICPRCIMSFDTAADELRQNVPDAVVEKLLKARKKAETLRLYKGKGCDRCSHTGYQGRIGIFEVLEVNDPVRELIMKNANANEIAKQAIASGMTTMFEDGVRKVLGGLTTIEEVIRVTGG